MPFYMTHKKHVVLLRRLPPPPKGEWGGMERLIIDWLEHADYSCCQITIAVAPGWKSKFDSEIAARSLPVRVVEFPFSFEVGPFRRFANMSEFLRKLKAAIAVFSQGWFWEFRLPDVIAGFLVTRNQAFMQENLGSPEPPPKTSRRHFGFIPGLGLWWRGKIFVTYTRAYFCRWVFVVSQDLKNKLVEDWKYPAKKIMVAYHGVNIERYTPSPEARERIRQSLGLSQSSLVAISTGRLTAQKCIDRMITAMDTLAGEYPHLHLLILGQGPLESELKKLASGCRGRERIHFLGQVADVSDYLKASDIYMLTSDNEGLSLALLEAMATGLICISTTCAGSPEAIQDGVTGFLVKKNAPAVTEGLRKALRLSIKEKSEMPAASVRFIRKNFEISKNVEKVFKVIGVPFLSLK